MQYDCRFTKQFIGEHVQLLPLIFIVKLDTWDLLGCTVFVNGGWCILRNIGVPILTCIWWSNRSCTLLDPSVSWGFCLFVCFLLFLFVFVFVFVLLLFCLLLFFFWMTSLISESVSHACHFRQCLVMFSGRRISQRCWNQLGYLSHSPVCLSTVSWYTCSDDSFAWPLLVCPRPASLDTIQYNTIQCYIAVLSRPLLMISELLPNGADLKYATINKLPMMPLPCWIVFKSIRWMNK